MNYRIYITILSFILFFMIVFNKKSIWNRKKLVFGCTDITFPAK